MKRIVLVVLVSFLGFSTYAQGIDLGIKLGANFSKVSDINTDLDNKTGFVGGAFLGLNFNEKAGILVEALYSQQGAKFELGEFDISYLNVPVLFKYKLIQGLNLQVGPQFGFVVDDKVSFDSVVGGAETAVETNSFDTSGVVGLGYDLPMGLRVSARYTFGFSEITDDGGKNSVITLAVGYSFL